jgi:hypothetical protein
LKHGVLSINGRQFQAWLTDRDDHGRRHTVIDLEKLGTMAGRVLAQHRVVIDPAGQAVRDCEDGRGGLHCRHAVCCRAALKEYGERVAAERAAALKVGGPVEADAAALGFEF